MFSSSFFAGNRHALRQLAKDRTVLLTGNGILQRKRDTTYDFAQDSNVWYVSGCNEPDVVVVVGQKPQDDAILIGARSTIQEAFNGTVNHDSLRNSSGIERILVGTEGRAYMRELLLPSRTCAVLMPDKTYDAHGQYYANPARRRFVASLRRLVDNLDIVDVRPWLRDLRTIKQPEEIEAIKRANAITAEAIAKVHSRLQSGEYQYEYEIEADITHHFRLSGATGHAYSPIVASNTNATTLHYVQNSAKLDPSGLLVLDVGAEVHGYAADVTRTLSWGKLTQRQRAVYTAVLEVQRQAVDMLKPGLTFREFETKTRELIGQKLIELGLVTTVDDRKGCLRYYPHATTHFLGLDVHDVGTYDQPLKPGMVLTCEPGIYIPEEGIGVRIEDDMLITKNGHENLSSACPK